MHILVVDDEKAVRDVIGRHLAGLGHRMGAAEDGLAAEAYLKDHEDVALVITDIRMPGRDGIELLRLAKAMRPEIEVVLMTGYAEVGSAASAVDAAAFAYLRKPFCIEEMVKTVERAVQHIEMVRERREHTRQLEEMVRKLETSEQRYRLLVEGIDGAVISTDEEFVIHSASQRCDEILGRSPQDLVGTPLDALRVGDDAEELRDTVSEVLRQGSGAVRLDGRLLRPDGSVLHTVEVATPFGGRAGESRGIFWIIEDGSTVHRLKVEAALARDYLEAVRRSHSETRRIVGESEPIRRVLELIQSIAGTAASVLICGESGTGKELVAESIHINSQRAGRPFVVVNCATLQETLLESELFGHKRGAFTGAVEDKRGLVEIAHGGTLFIDEVAEMVPAVQSKMLRVLEQGEFRRLGSTEDCTTDLRVIAATNRDLSAEVKAGRFREDLFYRLDVIRIDVPPLRERREDVPLIAEHMLRHARAGTRTPKRLSSDALEALTAYDWPGNVRELSNVIERAVILSGAEEIIKLRDLSIAPDVARKGVRTLRELENQEMEKALALCKGNKSRAAARLGITRQTLISRLKKLAEHEQGRGEVRA